MIRQTKIPLKILFTLVLSLLFTVTYEAQRQFTPSWSFFDKSHNFTLSNPINLDRIIFSLPASQITTTNFQITEEGYWKSSYTSKAAEINVVGFRQNLLVKLKWLQAGMKNITIRSETKRQQQDRYYVLYDSPPQTEEYDIWFVNGCDGEENSSVSTGVIFCSFNYSKEIEIQYDTTGKNGANIAQMRKVMNQNHPTNVNQLLKNLNINPSSFQSTQKLAQQMLQLTLASLCQQKSEYFLQRFFGLCSETSPKQIDPHYSLLVIDLLFSYDIDLAAWLTENFIDLLQEKLFYSFSDREWIPIPEHTQVFVTYLKNLQKNKKLSETEIRKKINKVIEIQNGLINNLLLSEVNHLSEEINYRENNKIHPTILKMLTQAWKTDSPRARVSSIYAESFTNDFFYHQQNQKLESSVGKMIWLIKLINQHILVVRTWGDSYQKEMLEQLVSLAKVMHGFVLDDPRAQNGDFHSIIEAENLKLYTRSIGYESLLPFAYEISTVFPTTTMLNLTTASGLASMPIAHEKAKQTYNFRGNINLYFNYKILFNMISKCETNPKLRVFYPGLKTVIESIQKFIRETYAQAQNNSENQVFYTSWTVKGKGVRSQNHLALINLAFLEQIKNVPSTASASKQNKSKSAEKKQSTQ